MIHGGVKDIKLYINRMSKYNKTRKIQKNKKSIKNISKKIKLRKSRKHIKKTKGGNNQEIYQQRLNSRGEIQTRIHTIANDPDMIYEEKRNTIESLREEATQLDNYFLSLHQNSHWLADSVEHINSAIDQIDNAMNMNDSDSDSDETVTLPRYNNNGNSSNGNSSNSNMSVYKN